MTLKRQCAFQLIKENECGGNNGSFRASFEFRLFLPPNILVLTVYISYKEWMFPDFLLIFQLSPMWKEMIFDARKFHTFKSLHNVFMHVDCLNIAGVGTEHRNYIPWRRL